MIVVNISKKMKPAILFEETTISKTETIRGTMMLRVNRRKHMNVGDPQSLEKPSGERESDMLIVVKITGKVKPEGAKGHYCKQVFQ